MASFSYVLYYHHDHIMVLMLLLSILLTFILFRSESLIMGVVPEIVGKGQLDGPEDLLYDPSTRVIYTGCWDGWIKRVKVNESAANSVVQNWVNVGGRPLGLALCPNGDVLAANSEKGLLRVTKKGKKIKVLTNQVKGLKFRLTNSVDVAKDGTIYFTDASYKYNVSEYISDFLEKKPHGRFMKYDPSTRRTTLLVSDLYFANGVAISPDEKFVVFCETAKRRCRKYYIKGPKKGRIGDFIADLPGLPDNIHYGDGRFWIGLITLPVTYSWDTTMGRVMATMMKYAGLKAPQGLKNGGVLVVNLEGKFTKHYFDPELSFTTSGIKIGNHIYCGSLVFPFILRFDE